MTKELELHWLKKLVKEVEGIKSELKKQKPLPKIGLAVDPEYVRENPRECALQMTRLRDALLRAMAHCDDYSAIRYRQERQALFDVLAGKPLPRRMRTAKTRRLQPRK